MDDLYKTPSIYTKYQYFIKSHLSNTKNIDELNFKSHPDYTYMLEHVDSSQGQKYLDLISKEFPNISEDIIQEFITLNDKIGKPIKCNIDKYNCSPTNFRYIYQANIILKYIDWSVQKKEVNILELGGGYGGLCLALHFFKRYYTHHIKSYTIVDLPEALELDKVYLSSHGLFPELLSALNYGQDYSHDKDSSFFISCYCVSELDRNIRKKYREILFHKFSRGFIVWNNAGPHCDDNPLQELGIHNCLIEFEKPQTGYSNRFIFF